MLEEEGGIVPARHLHPRGPVRLAVRDVVGEEVGPAEDVQAVDAREALRVVSGSWSDETAQILYQDVVSLLPVGQQEQVHVWSVAELGQAERVDDGILVAEHVDRHRVLGLEAPDGPGGDEERDAGHVELRLEVGVVGDAVRVAADVVEAGQDRPHETLVVIVVDVDDRLPSDELRRGWEVRRPVQGLVRRHVDGNVQNRIQRPPGSLRHVCVQTPSQAGDGRVHGRLDVVGDQDGDDVGAEDGLAGVDGAVDVDP